jgi:hypothetical protein
MPASRFGELLAAVVPLSDHDLHEIRELQLTSGRRFGDVALSLGLCRPEHVWRAWVTQLTRRSDSDLALGAPVNLDLLGVDTQAVSLLPRRLALRYRVVPLRAIGDDLIVAADPRTVARAAAELPALLEHAVRFVLADRAQLRLALRTYYASPTGPRLTRTG